MEFHYATVWEAIADAVPEQAALIQGSRTVGWRDYEQRSARLAAGLVAAGLTEGSKVALYLPNCPEYAEAQFAAFKLRAVPVNVNYRYMADELAYLLADSDAEAVVYDAGLADRVASARFRGDRVKLWIEVGDAGAPRLDGAVPYEAVVVDHDPLPRATRSPDDAYILYTGGTTGLPKGVVYRIGPMVAGFLSQLPVSAGLAPILDPADAAAAARQLADEGRPYTALPACPLMHGTGAWAGLLGPHLLGGTTVLTKNRSLDPAEIWSVTERHGVGTMVIVGDAFARPLLRQLEEDRAAGRVYDLGRFRFVISSGAMFAAETKAALLEHIPHLTIIDAIGASEGLMGMAVTVTGAPAETGRFLPFPTTKVFTDDGREVAPGSGEVGFLAAGGNVPVRYHKDEAKSATTFRDFGGVRYSLPGDLATVNADGTITLLGRGNHCINTGGEKVFPEEVEEAAKTHPAVEDCLVFGVEDERFGQRVVAVVSAADAGALPAEEDVIAHVRARLAPYKAPRRVVVTERVPRTPSGKADYAAARALLQ
jgi:fatty-acyl-CoA synthase